MAKFRVGQRVRVVWIEPNATWHMQHVLGKEATVIGRFHDLWAIDVDGVGTQTPFGPARFFDRQLAPLTDPKADEFIENIRKLKPLHEEPKVEREVSNAIRTYR